MSEFKVGDRVKRIKHGYMDVKVNEICTVKKISGSNILLEGKRSNYMDKYFIKEKPMSLRQRIKALNNGWDKEADDILEEIMKNKPLCIRIQQSRSPYVLAGHERAIVIESGKSVASLEMDGEDKYFPYSSQCSKNQAFKDALLWLLEKSGLEQPKQGDKAEVKVDGQVWEATLVRRA